MTRDGANAQPNSWDKNVFEYDGKMNTCIKLEYTLVSKVIKSGHSSSYYICN